MRKHICLFGLGMLIAVFLKFPCADGCAPVWGRLDRPVAIAEESAVIVWDAANKVQHFIRWARFENASSDFGFLVPTPTQPRLKEVDDNVFYRLEDWTAPKIVERRELHFEPMLCGCLGYAGRAPMPESAVRVLDRQIVGGMDAAVLEADNAEGLRQWLDKNGYVARPEFTAWLAPYIADKWKITAFKIAAGQNPGKAVQIAPVRMTFQTDRPFFPYREPKESDSASAFRGKRLLRVFFIGDGRMQGALGDSLWSARVPWSNALDSKRSEALRGALELNESELPSSARLTVFEDPASPRPSGGEVWFELAADQSSVLPPDRIVPYRVWIPGDVASVALVVLATIGYQVGKRARFKVRPTPASKSETPPPDMRSR